MCYGDCILHGSGGLKLFVLESIPCKTIRNEPQEGTCEEYISFQDAASQSYVTLLEVAALSPLPVILFPCR